MSRPPPQAPAVTSASSSAQPTYIPQLPLGTPSEDFVLASQSQTLPQQHLHEQQQLGSSNPRKRKAPDSSPMTAMQSAPVSGYGPPAAYAAQSQQGEQPADIPTQGTAPKKSRTNTPWSPAEEQRLKTMRDAGNSWSEIAKTFPNRTEGSVKKHWYKDMHYADFAADEVWMFFWIREDLLLMQ
ncbi:MAG: hypothetical protein Q9188_000325 [Gyalolechia gomerana]